MNLRLVESLAEAVVSLPSEDYAYFQDALVAKMVRKTPGVAGGYACVRDTRIAIWTLVSLLNQGADDDEILADFPGLTRFDIWITHFYYGSHQEEIDNLIASHDLGDEGDV